MSAGGEGLSSGLAQRTSLLAFGGLFLALLAAWAAGPGPWQALLALLVVAGTPLLAARLPGQAAGLLLLLAAAGSWLTFDVSGAWPPFALPGLLLHELAYFAGPPLLVYLLLDDVARQRLKLDALQVFAPLAVVSLGVGGFVAWRFQQGLEPLGREVALVATVYGICYLALLCVVLLARLTAPAPPPAPPPPAARAAQLEESGRFGLAARLYERDAQFQKGAEMAQRAGEWARAGELYRRAGEPFQAGEMHYRAQRWAEALECYEEARAWPAAARLCEQVGWLDKAVAYYEKAGNLAAGVRALEAAGRQPTPEQYLRAGLSAQAAARLEAEGAFERAAEVHEQNLHDRENALRLYLQAGVWPQAGRLLESLGRLDEAVQAYLAAPAGALDAARLCSTLGQPEQAARILEHLPPGELERLDDEATLTMVARVQAEAGRPDEAIRLLQSVKRRFPASGATCLLLGRAFLTKGLSELAEEELRVATSLPLEPAQELDAAYLLGCVLEAQERNAEAQQVFHGILQKDFRYSDVEQRYRRLKSLEGAAKPSGGGGAGSPLE